MTNPFEGGAGGIDYSQYQTWEKIVAPNGAVYYVIPGTGRLLDPNLSASKGKPVTFSDPRPEYEKKKGELEQQKKMQDQAMFNAGPVGQMIPVAGSLAGLYGANAIMNGGAGGLFGGTTGATAAAQGALAPAAPNVLGASVVSGAPTAAAAPAATGVMGTGLGVAPLAAIAGATYLGGKAGLDMLQGKGKAWQDASLQDNAGRVILGMATGGLSEVANKFFGGRETTRDHQKGNTEELLKQSDDPTWQGYVSAMREQNETGPSDASMPYGDSKGNKFANFADYKKSGLDASNLTGVVGNLQTFGPDWAKLSQEQRQKVTQGIIDADLYDSKKGEVVITDPTKAKSIFDSIVAGTQPSVLGMAKAPGIVPVNNATAAAQGALQVVNPARSTTLSPGINLKGQRISY